MSVLLNVQSTQQDPLVTRKFRFRAKYTAHLSNVYEVLNRRLDMNVNIEDIQLDLSGLYTGQLVTGCLQALCIRQAREYLRETPGFLLLHSLVYE
jgi:hypothetical protein